MIADVLGAIPILELGGIIIGLLNQFFLILHVIKIYMDIPIVQNVMWEFPGLI